jgi:pimeloyl-ACP methyl ester carboxylesterase
MHGWAGAGAYFDETLKYLDLTGLRAITFDLRGHGDSDKPDTGYSDERFARDAFTCGRCSWR